MTDSEIRFCPYCGHDINSLKAHLSPQKTEEVRQPDAADFKLRKAMFAICLLFSVIPVGILMAASMYEDYSDGIYDWVYSYGGIYVVIGMGAISAITGIIGLCSKK